MTRRTTTVVEREYDEAGQCVKETTTVTTDEHSCTSVIVGPPVQISYRPLYPQTTWITNVTNTNTTGAVTGRHAAPPDHDG